MSRLLTLGRFELRTAEASGTGSTIAMQPKRLALLTFLALSAPKGGMRRDVLLAHFWPDAATDEARNALRQALHHLRQHLGEDAVESRSDDQVALAAGALDCDAVEMERAVAEGDDARALKLYQGPFLDGVFVRGVSQEFEEWVERTRLRLRSTAADGARRLAERESAAGRMEAAIVAARRRCEIEPDHEGGLRALLMVLDDCGYRAEALQEATRFEQFLRSRYEVEPSAETVALVEAIRTGARTAAVRPGVPRIVAPPVPEPGPPSVRAYGWRNVALIVMLLSIVGVAVIEWRRPGRPGRPPPSALPIASS